ncbi:hypothetical protein HELRODRAFT_193524 [Helobdella robusta]|uniref:SUEL-type lectin domain-containing protein n=1 Tax=Helobdella robusta TaxID=6412 RepID=T1FV29_HELRO|nr:hypothetical protein HELRODRAFT_193524 [Helobdella robusta]ESN95494.1 hypothetical protein HELRODRAFT_193524 [Helobdella robusta]
MDNISLITDFIIFIFAILVSSFPIVASKPNEVRDYCQGEVFRTNCSSDEVVIMRSAVYGRMRKARCVNINMGYMGCQADVIDLADVKCSGRRSCEITVPDVAFESKEPCLDLKSYLEASYECKKVIAVNNNDCMNNRPLETTTTTGSIASVTAAEIATRYLDVNCQKYATIEEKGNGVFQDRVVPVCGHKLRYQELYTSRGHVVQLSLEARRVNPDHFLINYEIFGCADPTLSVHSWFKKESPNKATIRCKPTDEKWEVTCQGGVWVGAYSNCSDVMIGENMGRASMEDPTSQQYEKSRRSESPCSRGGYSDYSAANYEKMDDDLEDQFDHIYGRKGHPHLGDATACAWEIDVVWFDIVQSWEHGLLTLGLGSQFLHL